MINFSHCSRHFPPSKPPNDKGHKNNLIFIPKKILKPYIHILFAILLCTGMYSCKHETPDKQPALKVDPILTELNSALTKNPKEADLYFQRAKYYYSKKGYDEALHDLASAMKIDSLKPAYYYLLADTYLDYYQSRMALLTMQKASGMFPDSIGTLMKLAETEITLAKYDVAMQTIQKIVTLDPQNADARILMGLALENSKDPARAIYAYRKATELDPYKIDGWIKAGILADKLKTGDGLKYFQTALKIDTASYEANYALAMHYQQARDDAKALDIYRKLNLMYPRVAEPFFNIGAIYMTMDSLNKALDFFKMATSVDQVYAEAYYAQGKVLEQMNKPKEAYAKYNQAATLKPKFQAAGDAAARLKPK